jgi:hypothetical protein
VLLKINGEQVPYTLEKERLLAEFVGGVSDWLAGSGLVVTGIRMGADDLLALPRSDWERTPLTSVAELDFQVHQTADLRIEHWQTLHAWLGMLADEVGSPGPGLEELLTGAGETLADAASNPFQKDGPSLLAPLAGRIQGQSAEEVRRWPAERRKEVVGLIAGVRERLAARIAEASRPQEALKGCVGSLREALPLLSEVPVQLSTGRDRQAMQTIATVAELLQTLLALVPFLPPHPDLQGLFTELTGVFRDVIEAFDAKDSVLIGDLLEYEAAPRLAALLPLLEGGAS